MSRWVEPAPEGSPVVLVLKDLNFLGKTIDLGEPRGHTPVFPLGVTLAGVLGTAL